MEKIIKAVEKYRETIYEAERYIWAHAETGYKEYNTSAYMAEKFRELGYELTMADGITGFYTVIDTGKDGPEILILGELDSVICPTHPEANSKTGAVHACGHNAQCAALLGIAAALKEDGVLDGLCGRIKLCAVPAEELLEIEYRAKLKAEGKIKYFGGKTEFLSRGYFDSSDIAIMVHTANGEHFRIQSGHVGCIAKSITFKGKAAHAGGAPHDGINALYAANCALNAINAVRETFREPDLIRVHPIITAGGDIVNAIPEEVRIESYVRGASFDAILKENRKVNRALVGAALSLGANVDIKDFCGYAPQTNDPNLTDIAQEAIELIFPNETLLRNDAMSTGSTDLGDLSRVIPVLHPYAPGAVGIGHGNNYYINDPERACVGSAKLQLGILRLLLENGAQRARKVIEEYTPEFKSIPEYLEYIDTICASGDRITYTDGGATVKI